MATKRPISREMEIALRTIDGLLLLTAAAPVILAKFQANRALLEKLAHEQRGPTQAEWEAVESRLDEKGALIEELSKEQPSSG